MAAIVHTTAICVVALRVGITGMLAGRIFLGGTLLPSLRSGITW